MINIHTRNFIFLGALMMGLAVLLAAFGAHALKHSLSPAMQIVYETGAKYQFYHALGLLFISFLTYINKAKLVIIAGYLMFISTILFSFSLYFLSTTSIYWIGFITPIGGIGFVVSWILILISIKDLKVKQEH